MIKTDGILFDMDGTIWDNTPLFAKSWTRACQDHGYDITFSDKDLQKLFGRTMVEIADLAIPDEIPERRYETVRACEIYEMKDLLASKDSTTYPHLEEVLDYLSKKTKLFIVSNCQKGYIESYLMLNGHKKHFTDHICFGDNGLGKKDNIRYIIEKYNLKNPVYIGDIDKDREAAEQAGAGFIWASYGYGDQVKSYQAKIESIRELKDIIY